jgi:hypothetical protein
MKAKTAVVDWSGNYEENCIQLSKHLGKNKSDESCSTPSMGAAPNRVRRSS